MKAELFPFQKRAMTDLRLKIGEAIGGYQRTHLNQVVSFTAPTGAGKTIIMASLIENVFYGDVDYPEQPEGQEQQLLHHSILSITYQVRCHCLIILQVEKQHLLMW